MEVLNEFELSNEDLHKVIDLMNESMDKGLVGGLKDSSMAMLPSFVPCLPNGKGTCITELSKCTSINA